jgi:hypothetical protein
MADLDDMKMKAQDIGSDAKKKAKDAKTEGENMKDKLSHRMHNIDMNSENDDNRAQ